MLECASMMCDDDDDEPHPIRSKMPKIRKYDMFCELCGEDIEEWYRSLPKYVLHDWPALSDAKDKFIKQLIEEHPDFLSRSKPKYIKDAFLNRYVREKD